LTVSTASPQATFGISVPDGQSWSIGITPQNITSGWLSLSQTAGTGSAQITVTASANGFAAGAYLANLLIQGPNLSPPAITVQVVFVNGDSTGVTITSLTNAASGKSVAAPGMLATLTGTNLPDSPASYSGGAYSFYTSDVAITVNGVPAAWNSASHTQIKFQIPYETSVGTAVVGVSYGTKVGAYVFQVAPSAPGIFADATGSVGPVQAGKSIALTMTGEGVMSPALADGTSGSTALTYKPALPFTLTIGGVPAFLTSYGMGSASYDTTLNVAIPASAPTGVQPVVVTVAGVSSPPVNINITPAP
jgi:adhesin/invasin